MAQGAYLLRALTTSEHHKVVPYQVMLCVLAACGFSQALEVCFSCPAVLQPVTQTEARTCFSCMQQAGDCCFASGRKT
jgi:hypothetical protein